MPEYPKSFEVQQGVDETLKSSESGFDSNIEAREKDRETRRQFYIRKMKEPNVQALLKFLRQTPNLWEQVVQRYKNKDAFGRVANTLEAPEDISDPKEGIGALVPLWSTVCTVGGAHELFEIMFDRAAENESQAIKAELKEKTRYVRELVIGAGVHGAVFNAEFMEHAPRVSRLTVDASTRLGGQFRNYGGPAFALNSHNRPLNVDTSGILNNPNANTFGPHAPLQLPDVSGELFADNEILGMVAALNQYLSSDTLLGAEVKSVTENNDDSEGKYRVELVDVETGETIFLKTDRVIASMGLGSSDYGFKNMDDETRRICEAGDGRVLTYQQFLEKVGDRTNPFPLKDFVGKRVAIIGGGHSGLTAAEYLAGLGPRYSGSVASMGGPSEIIMVGTRFSDSKELLAKEAHRYAQLVTVMQGDESSKESLPLLVRPVSGFKAINLEEGAEIRGLSGKDKEIIIFCEKRDGDGNVVEQKEIKADVVITTTGFRDRFKDIFGNLIEGEPGSKRQFGSFLDDKFVADFPHPVARTLRDHRDIILVGPVAGIAANERELAIAKKYNRPPSPVGIPNTSDDTVRCARAIAGEDISSGQEGGWRFGLKVSPINLPEVGRLNLMDRKIQLDFRVPAEVENIKFPPEVRYEDLLQLAIMQHKNRYRSRENFEFKIVVKRNEDGSYIVSSDERLPSEYRSFVYRFLEDQMAQVAISKLLPKRAASKELEIKFSL